MLYAKYNLTIPIVKIIFQIKLKPILNIVSCNEINGVRNYMIERKISKFSIE
jgi:hypothetical protein